MRAITGANRDVERDKLRQIYYGAVEGQQASLTGIKTPSNHQSLKKQDKKIEKNYYGWELKYNEGLEESIELTNQIMDQKVVVVVYKEKNEAGLVPHLDVEFKTTAHLDMVQLGQLFEVIQDARQMLNR